MRVWDAGTGECVRALEGHTKGVNSVSWGRSADGKVVIASTSDKCSLFFDIGSGGTLVSASDSCMIEFSDFTCIPDDGSPVFGDGPTKYCSGGGLGYDAVYFGSSIVFYKTCCH